MARISPNEAKAWGEPTKLNIVALDAELLSHIEEEVLRRVSVAYTVTGWVDELTTPKIVRTAIAKLYVAWLYDRQYSENIVENGSTYAQRLQANAEMLILGIIDGTIEIPGGDNTTAGGTPVFYPTDESSAMEPTDEDPSLGPARFSMGMRF